MSIIIDSISIAGLRKTHLQQLANYIINADDGSYYGNKEQYRARHNDLLYIAEKLWSIAGDPDYKIAKRHSTDYFCIKPKRKGRR